MFTGLMRTIILYILIIAGVRLMGKRQVGELEPSELVLSLIIADLASVPMQDYGIPLLTGVEDRGALMRELYAIREVIVAPFDVMRQMDWRDFVEQYLQKELGAVHVVAGHDFHFGYKGEGDPRRLGEKCRELGMGCDVIPKVEIDGVAVSSTYIRALVEEGKMERAGWFLGHPHTLSGPVVHGSELGRTLGTPTANLLIPQGVIAPGFGVYAAKVRVLPDDPGRQPSRGTKYWFSPFIASGGFRGGGCMPASVRRI